MVAAIITNSITAVVVALAASSVGAIFSSTATDMGTQVSPIVFLIDWQDVPP
jgi:acyl-coenzyme A synthetase/AMP-(fatty) acid ligase